ncbi:MAG: hypothetical protein ACRER3_08875, partial [Pseudomonas fluorescens]
AFGVLLGELLERIDSGLSDEGRVQLEQLQQRCCQPQVLTRPGFSEIIQALTVLASTTGSQHKPVARNLATRHHTLEAV